MHATAASINTNRHVVDRLADIREAIKGLQEEEAKCKDEIAVRMGTKDSLGGAEFIAYQTVTSRKGAIDEAELKRRGIEVPRKPDTVVYSLRLQKRVQEDAA